MINPKATYGYAMNYGAGESSAIEPRMDISIVTRLTRNMA